MSEISRDEVLSMEQRKHTRNRVDYAASFSGDGIKGYGLIFDLSSTGCRARTNITVSKGEFVGVLIDVTRYTTPLQVALAVTRWSHGQEFGLEFTRMEPNHQQQLRELIQATEAAMALPQETETQ
jgi:hypothetical protein